MTKPVAKFVPRDDQIGLADAVLDILKVSKYAYLEAPTSHGKTLDMALIANDCGLRDILYVVNSTDTVTQTRAKVQELIEAGIAKPGLRWQFMTWLMYTSIARNRPDELPKRHLALVDECHIGGVKNSSGDDKQCFPEIKRHASKIVWVSATPWGLDEALMGERDGHTAYQSYNEAFQQGIINQCDIARVDCSLDFQVRLSDQTSAKALYRAEADLDITGTNADETFEQLSDLVTKIMDRKLRTTDVPDLVRFRWQLLAELYISRHRGQKAIFWLPNKAHARACAAYISRRMEQIDYAAAILGEQPGTVEAQDARFNLAEWQKPDGRVQVACVVYRLREGFDYPRLTYGFDCAWNPYNYRATIQKAGRLIRKAPAKKVSTYYYAVDAVSIAAASSRNFAARFMASLGNDYSPEAMTITANALADMSGIQTALTGIVPKVSGKPEVTSFTLRGAPVREARIPLFDVTDASGVVVGERCSLESMFYSTDERIEDIVQRIENGALRFSWKSQEGRFLNTYVRPSNARSFRPAVRERLIKAGVLRDREELSAAINVRLDAIVQRLKSGELVYEYDTPEITFLRRYTDASSPTFRPELRQCLVRDGILKDRRAKAAKIDQEIEKIVLRIEAGDLRFSWKSPEGKFLNPYLLPSTKRFRPTVYDRLVKAGAINSRQSLEDKIEKTVLSIEKGKIKYGRNTPAGKLLRRYVYPASAQFRPTLRQRLIDCGALKPAKTPKKIDAEIERVLRLIETGHATYSSNSWEKKFLSLYCQPSSATYRPAVRDRLVKAGALKPRDERWAEGELRIEETVQRIERGEIQYSHKSPETRFLHSYIAPANRQYRQDVRERLIKCGAIKPRDEITVEVELRIEEIVPRIERGEIQYSKKSPTTRFLAPYITPSGKLYRPDVRDRLIKCGALKPRLKK